MKSILGFDTLLTPRLLVLFYWICMLLILITGLLAIHSAGLVSSVVGIVVGMVFCRIGFELIMVAFKNNEYLRRIAENTSAQNNHPQP